MTREQVVEATGWAIRFADSVSETLAPNAEELAALRAWKPVPQPPTGSREVRNEPRRIHL